MARRLMLRAPQVLPRAEITGVGVFDPATLKADHRLIVLGSALSRLSSLEQSSLAPSATSRKIIAGLL
jgi:hypothetical protein